MQTILQKTEFTQHDILQLLQLSPSDSKQLFAHAAKIKEQTVENKVYLRGLIEFSNKCQKDCYYCGIRKSNTNVSRYTLSNQQIIDAAIFAHRNHYGSIVLQSGELQSPTFTENIANLLTQIHQATNNSLRITLSCGEQSADTYQHWFNAGAHRYLLRIESSNPQLYQKIHPNNPMHSHQTRLEAIQSLKTIGYQLGSGVMIGLPHQTITDLANDLLWIKTTNIDMVGMGPYIPHAQTPLSTQPSLLSSPIERFQTTLKMIAILRLMMPNINIASTTALQAIDKMGREKAITIGANILMPNITPGTYRDSYSLYDNKPCTDENPEDCKSCIDVRVSLINHTIAYNQTGDSQHFTNRQKT